MHQKKLKAVRPIPSETLSQCESFLFHTFGHSGRAVFIQSVDHHDHAMVLQLLRDGLLIRDVNHGWPIAPRGTPTERLAAERVVKLLEKDTRTR